MFKHRILERAIVAVAMGGMLVNLAGCGGSGGSSTKPAPPTITNAFGAGTIPLNGSATLTFNLSNPNAGTMLTGVGFTDSLPGGWSFRAEWPDRQLRWGDDNGCGWIAERKSVRGCSGRERRVQFLGECDGHDGGGQEQHDQRGNFE